MVFYVTLWSVSYGSYLNKVRHSKVGDSISPRLFENNIWTHQIVTSVKTSGIAIVTSLNFVVIELYLE